MLELSLRNLMQTSVARSSVYESRVNSLSSIALGWIALVVVAALAILSQRPPKAKDTTAPATEFSAARAMQQVGRMTKAPHPLGTVAHDETRDAVVAALREMQVEPQLETHVGISAGGSYVAAGRITNIIARVPGTSNSGAILITAHYDSVERAPGAGDDAGGVATALETLRAVTAGPRLKNDLVLLITDGEEAGLLGAEAAAVHDAWLRDAGLMLDFEGRGDQGQSFMFETSAGNRRLIEEMARTVAYPAASSLTYAVYKKMPNDTDFSVFRELGIPGLNFAWGGHVEAYHSRLDTAANLSLDSLQHDGSYALALVEHFGNQDLSEHKLQGKQDAVYFNLFGHQLVHYPERWAMPLQILALLLVIGAAAFAVAQGQVRLVAVLSGLLASLLLVVLATAASAAAFWLIQTTVGKHLPFGDVPANYLFLMTLVLVATAVAVAFTAVLRKRVAVLPLAPGGALLVALLGMVVAKMIPGGSYLLLWPLLAAVPALWCGERAALRWLAPVVALLFFAPLIQTLFVFLFLSMPTAIASGVLVGLVTVLSMPLWMRLTARPSGTSGVLIAAAVVCLVMGVVIARPSVAHPHPDTLSLGQDADSGKAVWYSLDEAPDAWTKNYLTGTPSRGAIPEFIGGFKQVMLWHPAPALPLPAPVAEVSGDNTAGVRTIHLTLQSPRKAPAMRLVFEKEVRVTGVTIENEPVPTSVWAKGSRKASAPIFDLYAFGGEPVQVTLQVQGDPGCRVWLSDRSYGLGEVPGDPAASRPADRMAWYGSDMVVITRALQLC
jgi:Peptidase family M28